MTNDPVLALAEKWRKELEDHIVKSTEAPDVATCIEELESILPQRDAERDAATRVAALEEAELWHERVLQIDPHALDEPAFDCCDRVAELRKLAGKDEVSE